MSTDETQRNRLWNFRQIVDSVGGVNEAARIMGKHNSYITQLISDPPTRGIGRKWVGYIETAFNLKPGSIDQPPPKQAMNNDAYLSQICAVLANAPDEDKEFARKIFSRNDCLPFSNRLCLS